MKKILSLLLLLFPCSAFVEEPVLFKDHLWGNLAFVKPLKNSLMVLQNQQNHIFLFNPVLHKTSLASFSSNPPPKNYLLTNAKINQNNSILLEFSSTTSSSNKYFYGQFSPNEVSYVFAPYTTSFSHFETDRIEGKTTLKSITQTHNLKAVDTSTPCEVYIWSNYVYLACEQAVIIIPPTKI